MIDTHVIRVGRQTGDVRVLREVSWTIPETESRPAEDAVSPSHAEVLVWRCR